MKQKKIILMGLVFVVLVSSILVYLLFIKENIRTIYTYSYDQGTVFEFAQLEDVRRVRVSAKIDAEYVTFRVPDKEYFIDQYVLNHANFVDSFELYSEGGDYYRMFYIFEHENHLFSLYYLDNYDIFRLEHVGATIEMKLMDTTTTLFYMPFPVFDSFEGTYSNGDVILWEDIRWEPWESFKDAAAFYEKLNDFLVIIDYEQQTIRLNGLSIYVSVEDFTENYPVILRFYEEGFSIGTDFNES